MTIEQLQRQAKLSRALNLKPEIRTICAKLKKLTTLKMENYEIESLIQQLDLPFRVHLFIMGNFSDLMALNYKE